MNDNYEALLTRPSQNERDQRGGFHFLLFVFSRVIHLAWEAREALLREQQRLSEPPPRIVSDIRSKLMQMGSIPSSKFSNGEQPSNDAVSDIDAGNPSPHAVPLDLDGQHGTGGGQSFSASGPTGSYPNIHRQVTLDANMNQTWIEIDWSWMQT